MTNNDIKIHSLKYCRNILGLTQNDLAVLLGCTTSNYSQKEAGRIEIGRKEMLLIQSAFNKILRNKGGKELTLDDIFLPKGL